MLKVVKAPVEGVVAPIAILLILPAVAGLIVTVPVPVGLIATLALAGDNVAVPVVLKVVKRPVDGVVAPTGVLLMLPPLITAVGIVAVPVKVGEATGARVVSVGWT